MRRMSSETVRAISGDTDRVKASIGRSHGWQYWAVTASRSRVVVLAPPPCHRVPTKKTHEPAGITTGSEGSSGLGRRLPQRWLPGYSTVAPLSAAKSSIAQIVAAANGARGRGIG